MMKKIEMATRLLYTGPLSSKFESMALYSSLEEMVQKRDVTHTHTHTLIQRSICLTVVLLPAERSVFEWAWCTDAEQIIAHFGQPSKVEIVKSASIPLRMLSKFSSELVHSLLRTSISWSAPSWYFIYQPLVVRKKHSGSH